MSRNRFKTCVSEHLGTINNISKLFVDCLECEHQSGIGHCFSAFDVENKGEVRHI